MTSTSIDLPTTVGLLVGVLALVSTFVNYIVFQAKLRWEADQFKCEKARIWEIIDSIMLSIKQLEKNEQEVPRSIEKRLDRLEETMTNIQASMGSLQGEIKALAMFLEKRNEK